MRGKMKQGFTTDRHRQPHVPLGNILEKLVRSLGLSRAYNGWMVVNRWAEIAGPQIARRAPAIRFEDDTLFIAAADASWRQTLSLQEDDLLKKIHSYPFGAAVKRLRFVTGRKGIR